MTEHGYTLVHHRDAPFLAYTLADEPSFFEARLFLRGPLMDRAEGDSERARSLLSAIVPAKGPLVAPKQVHGSHIIEAEPSAALPTRPAGDGVYLKRTDIEASLRFADCLPVVIASDMPSPRMIILHSGYKGTVLDIAGKACRRYFSEAQRSSRLWAWVGPGIGRDFYFRRLGEEWTTQGIQSFEAANVTISESAAYFDLAGQIRHQLLSEGLRQENVFMIPICTFLRNELCYSYRRGDHGGHLFLLASLIG